MLKLQCKYQFWTVALLLLLLLNNLTVSSCNDVFDTNCLMHNQSVYSYPNETVQRDAIELLEMLSNVTNGSYCIKVLNRFLCSIIFPPYGQSGDIIQTICPESCQNYVANGICAVHVEAMQDLLFRKNMTAIANDLHDCSSPLLQPINNTSNDCFNLPGLLNRMDHVQCIPLPEENMCPHQQFDAYAIDVSFMPSVLEYRDILATLNNRHRNISACAQFLNVSLCSTTFIPCSLLTYMLLPVCENDCEVIRHGILRCFEFLARNNLDFTEFGQFGSGFNCLDPGSYVPGVSGNLYSSLNVCRNFELIFPEESSINDNNFSVGPVVGPIVGVIVAATAFITIVVFVLWKHKKRNVIVLNARLQSNAGYSIESTLKHKCADLFTERLNLFESYKHELGSMYVRANDLSLVAIVGEGTFGIVYHSFYQDPVSGKGINVAVKGLKDSSSLKDIQSLLEECCKMKHFSHPNVLPLLGVSIDIENIPAMILPYMENGDVKAYLKAQRVSEHDVDAFPANITYSVLHKMCCDIAEGMEYLSRLHFVHRDLAARNCMVSSDLFIKISDFGLCRDIYESDYYKLKHKSRVPVKWMSPESLHDGIYSHQSDVWSFGITCWEIFSLGRQPYPGVDNPEVAKHLGDGNRLDQPTLCSDEVYQLMLSCWINSPKERPRFTTIVQLLKNLNE